jgi:hypothetical protein
MVPIAQLKRLPGSANPGMVPRQVGHGLFEVDATWGTVQPIELARRADDR